MNNNLKATSRAPVFQSFTEQPRDRFARAQRELGTTESGRKNVEGWGSEFGSGVTREWVTFTDSPRLTFHGGPYGSDPKLS